EVARVDRLHAGGAELVGERHAGGDGGDALFVGRRLFLGHGGHGRCEHCGHHGESENAGHGSVLRPLTMRRMCQMAQLSTNPFESVTYSGRAVGGRVRTCDVSAQVCAHFGLVYSRAAISSARVDSDTGSRTMRQWSGESAKSSGTMRTTCIAGCRARRRAMRTS